MIGLTIKGFRRHVNGCMKNLLTIWHSDNDIFTRYDLEGQNIRWTPVLSNGWLLKSAFRIQGDLSCEMAGCSMHTPVMSKS